MTFYMYSFSAWIVFLTQQPLSLFLSFWLVLFTATDGLPGSANGFFQSNCNGLQIAITFQMIWSMLSNAFLVSFFFCLMSKSEKRSIQIIFSKKLCVNVTDGKVCVNVRCYDLVRFKKRSLRVCFLVSVIVVLSLIYNKFAAKLRSLNNI